MKKKDIFDHELISLLRSFTNDEIKKFGLYLNSPYFSKRKALFVFYNELVKFHPLYTHVRLTKENLFKKIYECNAYKDSTMRDLFTETITEAKGFLAHESYADDNLYTVNILRQLRLRNQHHLFRNHLKKANEELDNYGGVDPSFFMLKFFIDGENYNENLIFRKLNSVKSFLNQAKEIENSSINLFIYSILQNVSNYIILLSRDDKSSIKQTEKIMTDLIRNLDLRKTYESLKGKSKYDFILEIYDLLLIALIKRGDWQAYTDFREAVERNINVIGHDEAADLHSNMITIAIFGTKTGNDRNKFNYELLKIYDTYIKKNYFNVKKSCFITPDLYRAIIFHAVKMQKTGWLASLITESAQWLNPEARESLLNYASSYFYFATGAYNDALDAINKIDIEYYLFRYDLYVLKLKTFFELGEYEYALDLIMAFRKFILVEKLMQEERKGNYRSFTKYLEKIIKISLDSSQTDADSLVLKFQKDKNIISADWILEKIKILQAPAKRYKRFI